MFTHVYIHRNGHAIWCFYRYNGLLAMITLSLKECLKALKGLVVMSPDLEDVATSVYNNQVCILTQHEPGAGTPIRR